MTIERTDSAQAHFDRLVNDEANQLVADINKPLFAPVPAPQYRNGETAHAKGYSEGYDDGEAERRILADDNDVLLTVLRQVRILAIEGEPYGSIVNFINEKAGTFL